MLRRIIHKALGALGSVSPTLEFDEAIRLNPQDAGAYYSRGYDGPGGWLPADDVEIVENEKTAGFPRTLTGVEVHVRYREFDRPEALDPVTVPPPS